MATTPTGPAGPYRAQSLTRGLRVLRTLAAQRQPLTLVQLNQLTGIPKPTLVRLLSILTAEGCTVRRDNRPTFDLGPTIVEIAAGVDSELDPATAAQPHLSRVSASLGQTVTLAVLVGGEVLTVAVALADRPIRHDTHSGIRLPSWCCSLGKALLAFTEPAVIKERLAGLKLTALTSHSITTKASLDADLRLIRQRGWSHEDQESALGLSGFAVPIVVGQAAVGAISVTGPSAELGLAAAEQIVPQLIETATDLAAHATLVRGLQSLSGVDEPGA